jgi:FkbH-like protein
MEQREMRFVLISDFTIDSLAVLLQGDDSGIAAVEVADIGQVVPSLLALAQAPKNDQADAVIVWTRPEDAVPGFAGFSGAPTNGNPGSDLNNEVNAFADHILAAAKKVDLLFVPTWTITPYRRGLGLLHMQPGVGAGHALSTMNLRLMEHLADAANVHVMDAQRWVSLAGAGAVNPKQWYMAKAAFSNDVFKEAVLDIKAALTAIRGEGRKLLILDLDDTLWGGVVGEDGVDGMTLGGHDAVGEAFADFQRHVKALRDRGVLVGIVSKNDEKTALHAIRTHPEMVLTVEDFAGWRINWDDKAQNIADLTEELNLGLQSVVFIDDSAFERGRVAEALTDVLVPDWPANPMLFVRALEGLRCFDPAAVTAEDLDRQDMIMDERAREAVKAKVGSLEDWLKTLDLTITAEDLNATNLKRASQLLNKTNQMNLRTRRMPETEFNDWAERADHWCWTFRVSDRFGDSGLTALLSLERKEDTAEIIDFVVSCRVFRRGVEAAMLARAVSFCCELGLKQLRAVYLATDNNSPCLEFLQRAGLTALDGGDDEATFVWDLADAFDPPAHINLEG